MTIIVLIIALAFVVLLWNLRREQRRRRYQMGLREATPSLRDLHQADLDRIRDLDEALELDGWTETTYHGLDRECSHGWGDWWGLFARDVEQRRCKNCGRTEERPGPMGIYPYEGRS